MIAPRTSDAIFEAIRIPYVTADEALALLRTELARFLALVETLDLADWTKPTACTLWTVRDILAHQAGGYASGTGYRELIHQYRAALKRNRLPEDAINELQLTERVGKSPAELIAELRQAGPIASNKWAYQFRLFKLVSVPHPVAGLLSGRHLMWVIHSRDTWMHRLDICRATGREFEQSSGHDDRIAALVMLDVAKTLGPKLNGRAVLFELSGLAGGVWKIGLGEPAASIEMDALDFNVYASGRYTYAEACSKSILNGDIDLAKFALSKTAVLY